MFSTSNKLTAPPKLRESFGKLSELQKEASDLLDTCMAGGTANLGLAQKLSQQLGKANVEFGNIWNDQRVELILSDGTPQTIFTPDYATISRFFDENGIIGLTTEADLIAESCYINSVGRIHTLIIQPSQSASVFKTKSLQMLPGLWRLELWNRASDPKELAELFNLKYLGLCTPDIPELEALKKLKLRELSWQLCHSSAREEAKIEVDLALFSLFNSLEALRIKGSSIPKQDICVSDLTPLAALPKLRVFSISNARISQMTITEPLTQITGISINNSAVDDLSFITSMPNLRSINLVKSEISCQTIPWLPDLVYIDMTDSKVPNLASIMKPILTLEKLKLVRLPAPSGGTYSDEEKTLIKEIQRRAGLEVIGVPYANEI